MTRYYESMKIIEPVLEKLLNEQKTHQPEEIIMNLARKTKLAPVTLGPCFFLINNKLKSKLPCPAGRLAHLARKKNILN